MRFAFTDDQLAFRDAVRDLLAKECPPAAVRAAWDAADGPGRGLDPGVGRARGDGRARCRSRPRTTGGLGLTEVDLVLLLEESGVAALPGADRRARDGRCAARRRPPRDPGRSSPRRSPTTRSCRTPTWRRDLLLFDSVPWYLVDRRGRSSCALGPSVDHARRLAEVGVDARRRPTVVGRGFRRGTARSIAVRSAPPRSSSGWHVG